MMNEDELRRILEDVLREGVNGVTPLTGPAFGTTFHLYPVPDSDEVEVRVLIKQKHLPRLLFPLILEDVEKAIEETHAEVGSWENAECRIGALLALSSLTKRLHQQMGGEQ